MLDKELNELEKKLHESAKKENDIPLDSFKNVYSKIEGSLESAEVHNKVGTDLPDIFCGGQSSGIVSKARRKIVVAVVALLIVISIVVTVSIVVIRWDNGTNISGGNSIIETELTEQVTTQYQFQESIESLGINLIDVSNYDVTEYWLLIYNDLGVKGGKVSVKSFNYEACIKFYCLDVVLDKSISADYNMEYYVGYTAITYKKADSGLYGYSYEALAWNEGIPYRIEYYSDTDDIIDFFNNLFA